MSAIDPYGRREPPPTVDNRPTMSLEEELRADELAHIRTALPQLSLEDLRHLRNLIESLARRPPEAPRQSQPDREYLFWEADG